MKNEALVLASPPPPTLADMLAPLLTNEMLRELCDERTIRVGRSEPSWLMTRTLLREVIVAAMARVAGLPADEADDEPDRDDGPQDSSRLNWLEAQGYLTIDSYVLLDGSPLHQLMDKAGDVVGEGVDLRAAIDDAIGGSL